MAAIIAITAILFIVLLKMTDSVVLCPITLGDPGSRDQGLSLSPSPTALGSKHTQKKFLGKWVDDR